MKAWLTWLARFAHGDYKGIETPIGFIPKYEDMKETFADTIGKDYPRDLYDKQFSIYVDLILGSHRAAARGLRQGREPAEAAVQGLRRVGSRPEGAEGASTVRS